MYDLDSSEKQKINLSPLGGKKSNNIWPAVLTLGAGFALGALFFGQEFIAKNFNFSITPTGETQRETVQKIEYVAQTSQEEAVINAVKNYSPAVVSIIITKDMPVYERYYSREFDPFGFWNFEIPQLRQKGTQERQIGAGTGFIVDASGTILTNKHVVSDISAQYTVVMSDGAQFSAKVLASDPSHDIAVMEISDGAGREFPFVKLGDSDNLQIGQSVIAIGNALGEFDNTVSVGVISGMQRSIVAYGSGSGEVLDDLIQTDAAINEGNSGGPLLNLKGEVIGINTAIASGAQNVGFVIPINLAKRGLDQAKASGKITYPYLGVYYSMINEGVKKANDLPVDYGAWINTDDAKIASVVSGSPAQAAGLKDKDIILEVDGQKLAQTDSLARVLAKYNPGDKVKLKVLRAGGEIELEVTLGER
jgi:S1-C subfamily serine protease